jgi:hypothetical protein
MHRLGMKMSDEDTPPKEIVCHIAANNLSQMPGN